MNTYRAREHYDLHWKYTGSKLAENPYTTERIKAIVDTIPGDVLSIADVGCGNGLLTNILAEKYKVVGVELSREALRNVVCDRINCSAGHLGLRDGCVDLALSSEVLEDLPDEIFYNAVNELKRISKKYILITVPNKENLRERLVKCNICGLEFHLYLHLRSFDKAEFTRLFKGWISKHSVELGPPEVRSYNVISFELISKLHILGVLLCMLCL